MTRRFSRADDRVQNNARRFWGAHTVRVLVMVSRLRKLSKRSDAALYKPANPRWFRKIRCRSFPNERPGRNLELSPDQSLAQGSRSVSFSSHINTAKMTRHEMGISSFEHLASFDI